MKPSRYYMLIIFISILFVILLIRLSQIQLFSSKSFGPNEINLLEKSVNQRAQQVVLSSGRGTILDRNGVEITNKEVYDVIVFPSMTVQVDTYRKIAEVLNTSQEKIKQVSVEINKPTYLTELLNIDISAKQYEEIDKLEIVGYYPVKRTNVGDPQVAQHFVGLVRNNPTLYKERYEDEKLLQEIKPVGISGIEEAFDSFLIAKEEEKLLYHVDAVGEPMFGFELLYAGYDNSFYPLKVKTTLQLDFQQRAEELLAHYDLKEGGIVLLDIESRDVLAMASRPNVNLSNPYDKNSLTNQLLTTNFPGSVFKTVIAHAALENIPDLNQRSFDCSLNMYGDKDDRDLGNLNFEQSFAQSCNRTFGLLAIELMEQDRDIIENYAEKLGIIGPVGWEGEVFKYNQFKHFPSEETGVIWSEESEKVDNNYILQTAIGQRNVRVTPLAIANMMATIASNGVQKEVRGVKEVLYKNGATMTVFSEQEEKGNINNPYTMNRLQNLLTLVTESGTGTSLNGLKVAGKTGTAEVIKNKVHHHWFGGYFPHDNPKYAMVIVDLNNETGKTNIYTIYKEMVEFLYSYS